MDTARIGGIGKRRGEMNMKQQVVVIHGGTTFDTYEEYLSFLKTREISLKRMKTGDDWKETLAKRLGGEFEVLCPRMPNGANARYEEWKIWLERIIPLLSAGPIFIGQSLGGIFLAKYFSENTVNLNTKAVILVAAPFDDSDSEETLGDFRLPLSFSGFSDQAGTIIVIQSEDDQIVKFGQMEKYRKALPKAKFVVFRDRGHFDQEDFPELVDLIEEVSV